jgi:hypothetical protein
MSNGSIDQLDKADPPAIPDTYIFYLALICLNLIADGLAGLALPRFSGSFKPMTDEEKHKLESTKKELSLVTDMANVAWPGLLAAMSFYLTANLDEELFQNTMRSYQNFTNVCGVLDLITPRDAFLTNLCKNSIPVIPILSSGHLLSGNKSTGSTTSVNTIIPGTSNAALSFSDLSVQQQQTLSNITLNDKNMYSLRILLNIAMFLGSVLGSSWYLVLETLQLADFLLFNRPTPKGLTAASSTGGNPSATTLRRTITGSSVSTINTLQQGQAGK